MCAYVCIYRWHAAVGGEGQGGKVRKESEQHDQEGRDLHVEAHGEKEKDEHHLHLLALTVMVMVSKCTIMGFKNKGDDVQE
jgi:hypothetical protein